MALKLNGKDDRLRRADFRAFAATAGIRASDGEAAIDELLSRLDEGLKSVALPPIVPEGSAAAISAERMRVLVKERLDAFA